MLNRFPPQRVVGTFESNFDLTEHERHRLLQLGINETALIHPNPIRAGYVILDGQGQFDFEQHLRLGVVGKRVLLFLETDIHGSAHDIVAFDMTSGRTASWLGRTWALGQDMVYRDFSSRGGLHVRRSLISWLQACRDGIVVMSMPEAATVLNCTGPLIAEDYDHGLELLEGFRHLRIAPPRILVPSPSHFIDS